MYFDEDLLLDIRLNSLNKYVKKFVIAEATYTHNGSPKKLRFDINKFKKFRDKIDCDEILFKQIIKSAFNQRRKTLRNSLKSFKKIENIKEHSIFDKRAEELDVDDYIFLTNLISNGNI